MMSIRAVLAAALALGLLAVPLAAEAQAPPNVPRVGYLSIGSASDPRRAALFGAVQQGLRERVASVADHLPHFVVGRKGGAPLMTG